MVATKFALEEVGAQRSPKKAPENIAPAVTFRSTPPPFAKTINTTPIVPTVPKLVPKVKETMQDNINANNMKILRNNYLWFHSKRKMELFRKPSK